MNPLYCSQGHENSLNSRFCYQCGEQLKFAAKQQGIYSGLILGDRYRIIKQLGQGGFGRTYLAEDINRFSEMCVLKEFAPQVQSNAVLQKAEELFAREAGVLYKLQHPQIPRFRELFRVNVDGKGYLFLVQDYVEGKNYYSLLAARQPQRFSEAEVRELLINILPVLEYIHSLGVIHRDISPDNLILRTSDSLPILIDFGGVKQVAATVSQLEQSEAGTSVPPTLLGKVGFAPNEQMRTGAVYPHSDLYALAVTILVLLTGKNPQALIDDRTLSWQWEKEVNVSPNLATVLNKMLQPNMSDRYQNAREVWQALNVSSEPTFTETPAYTGASVVRNYQAPTIVSNPHQEKSALGKILLGSLVLLGLAGTTFWGVNSYLQSASNPPEVETTPSPIASASPSITPSSITPSPASPAPQLSAAEQSQVQTLLAQRKTLGIDDNFYFSIMNQLFWAKYPQYQGRKLTNEPADAQARSQWYKMAEDLLSKLETLSQSARQKLGNYTQADRDRSVEAISQVYVGSRSLYDLADAAFFELFPEQRGKDFINLPVGQIWNAIAIDKANEITSNKAYEQITFAPGTTGTNLSASLTPGEGKVYIAHLQPEQIMQINLEADPQLLISIYSPTGKVLTADSSSRTWSGSLQEKGFYEIVIVSTASSTKNYDLSLNVEDNTPTVTEPSAPQTDTPPPSPDLETSPSP